MGAGYAAALGGLLHSALGPESDPTSRAVAERLERYRVANRPIRIADRTADWTLLITSGEFGDKLAFGFRGCHDALDPDELARRAEGKCDLRVVAALPNRLLEPLLSAEGAGTRFLAPAMRNMTDGDHPLGRVADRVDILCCNRTEWEALRDPSALISRVGIVAVTDGARGLDVHFTDSKRGPDRIHVPAVPRDRPPRDTNRAGEAFGSTFVGCLLDHGWEGGHRAVDEGLVRTSGRAWGGRGRAGARPAGIRVPRARRDRRGVAGWARALIAHRTTSEGAARPASAGSLAGRHRRGLANRARLDQLFGLAPKRDGRVIGRAARLP